MMPTAQVAPHSFVLTDEQQEVVNSDCSALVVTAPAGTGKTEVLTRRSERFLTDAASKYARVLVVTYTTRAANEFTARLKNRVGNMMERVTATTVHGFSQTLLTTQGSHVGLPVDFQVLTNDADRADLLATYDRSWQPDDCTGLFTELDLVRATGDSHPRLQTWRDALKDMGAVDYSEMVAKATEVLLIPALSQMTRQIYGLVIVDEAQNLTRQQYDLLSALIGRHSQSASPLVPTVLLGDPNQSVISFAGGNRELMERFAREYGAKRFHLTRNFRSSRRLARLERRVSQKLSTSHKRGDDQPNSAAEGILCWREFEDEQAEADDIANWVTRLVDSGMPAEALAYGEPSTLNAEDIAVLARSGTALNATSEALIDRGYEVALSHKDSELMSSRLGAVALELMRFHSDRHHTLAVAALARDFGIDLSASVDQTNGASLNISTDALRSADDENFIVLEPLLSTDSPEFFVEALKDCQLTEDENVKLLANWNADCNLVTNAWLEFTNITPVAERSWTRFVLHFERMARGRDLGRGVRLLTVHKAQAREFKAVAIVGMNDGQFPDFRAESLAEKQAELQTFYVAVTRASRILRLTRARTRPTRYGDRTTDPSPFLQLARDAVHADS